MPEIQASRRLVKSPPELWAEVSDAASLARHLGEVGEITITRLEPETTVAWEGERASGTVELAPAGWGTSVTLTAEPVGAAEEPPAPEPTPEPIAVAEPEPEPEPFATAEPEPTVAEPAQAEPAADAPPVRRFWLARLFSRTPKSPAAPEPRPSTTDADRAAAPPAEPVVAGETISAAPPAESSSPATGPARSSAETEPQPAAAEPKPDPLEATLTHALDSLGQAHHRPFSRG
jgi:hypothetical protein